MAQVRCLPPSLRQSALCEYVPTVRQSSCSPRSVVEAPLGDFGCVRAEAPHGFLEIRNTTFRYQQTAAAGAESEATPLPESKPSSN